MNQTSFHDDIVSDRRILYTPSPFAKKALLHLQEIGSLTAVEPHTSRRNHMDSFLFFIVESGEGTLHYRGTTYDLKPGDCVFINCKDPYSHHTSHRLWSLRWVHFFGNNLEEIYEKYEQRGGMPTFTPAHLSQLENTLAELTSIAEGTDSIRDMLLCEKLMTLLTGIMKEGCPEFRNHGEKKRRILSDVKDYLDEFFQTEISLDDLAERFFINKYYLTRIFKEQFGQSILSYVTGVRITRSKQLLRFSDYSMEEIALECGFCDGNYFARTFKKTEGITPGQFRKTWRA